MVFNLNKKVFISYRRSSQVNYAHLLETHLKHVGCNVFLDVNMPPGVEFPSEIRKGISQSDCMIVFICHHWAEMFAHRKQSGEKDYVVKEISMAIEQKKQIIPLLLDGAKMPNEADLPIEIKSIAMLQAKEFKLEAKEELFLLLENEIGCRKKVNYMTLVLSLNIFIFLLLGIWYFGLFSFLSKPKYVHQANNQPEVMKPSELMIPDHRFGANKLEELLKVFIDKQSDHNHINLIDDLLASINALKLRDLEGSDRVFIELTELYLKINKKKWPVEFLGASVQLKTYHEDYLLFQEKWLQLAKLKTSKAMKYFMREMRMPRHLDLEFSQCLSYLESPFFVYGVINNRPGWSIKAFNPIRAWRNRDVSQDNNECSLKISSSFHHDIIYNVTNKDLNFFLPLYVDQPIYVDIKCQKEEGVSTEVLPNLQDGIENSVVKTLSKVFNVENQSLNRSTDLKNRDVCKGYVK